MVEFFQTNRDIVFFVYGLAFFVLGLAVALQSRRHSRIALARHLWLLATFGIVHGVYEWGAVFIPIQQTYSDLAAVNILYLIRLALETVSFFALFQFGVELLAEGPRARYLRFLPIVLLGLWGAAISIIWAMGDLPFAAWRDIGDIFARYLLGMPGASFAAVGLGHQARQVNRMDLPRIARYFRGAAWVFAAYALSSAVVPRADFFPASALNYDFLLQTIGVPAAIFRAACGTLIAYLIIRGMEIFDVETDRLLEEAAQARAVAEDRERIGRELHDSIIQSLYAAGLTLEDAALTIDEDAARAKVRVNEVIHALDRTIRDIRTYILDLRHARESGDWETDLEELIRAFRLQTLVDADFLVEGDAFPLANGAGKQILTIAREALTNVAKHARATRVRARLVYQSAHIELEISDNGIGFAWEEILSVAEPGEHQGLRNMQERAELIGARLSIESAPQRGTTVRLILRNGTHGSRNTSCRSESSW